MQCARDGGNTRVNSTKISISRYRENISRAVRPNGKFHDARDRRVRRISSERRIGTDELPDRIPRYNADEKNASGARGSDRCRETSFFEAHCILRVHEMLNGKFGAVHGEVQGVRAVVRGMWEKIASSVKRPRLAEFLVNFPRIQPVCIAPPEGRRTLEVAECFEVILEGYYYLARLTRESFQRPRRKRGSFERRPRRLLSLSLFLSFVTLNTSRLICEQVARETHDGVAKFKAIADHITERTPG